MDNEEPGSQLGKDAFTNVSFVVIEIMKQTVVGGVAKLQ